jgi:hypothetical protein
MKLRYLHLSDLHFSAGKEGKPSILFNHDYVTRPMLECIKKLVEEKESDQKKRKKYLILLLLPVTLHLAVMKKIMKKQNIFVKNY